MTLDFVFKTATGKAPQEWMESGDLDWYEKYANSPTEQPKAGILVADWNHFPKMAANAWPRTTESEAAQAFNWGKGRKFQRILEKMGYELEWSDDGSRCDHCNGWISRNDHFQDKAYVKGDTLCRACILADFEAEYIEVAAKNGELLLHGTNPAPYGFVKVAECWNHEETKEYKRLKALGYSDICFSGQPTGGNRDIDVWAKGMPSMTQWQQTVECGASIEVTA